ncbi:TAFII28-like protein [Macleaya cordata]|uniref:TAFII28-like protein n=1 Tax=Macleaya cordata TaxID=56857 RepID=A0A200PSW2_MACCD|nr:TAFII28-like protein [Macleaya cordata]
MVDTQTTPSTTKVVDGDELTANVRSSTLNNNNNTNNNNKKKKKQNQSSTSVEPQLGNPGTSGKNKDDEEEEEEENMDVELGKFPSSASVLLFRAILSQFTEEQMSRYESFRRSGFQKANMKKILFPVLGREGEK